MQAALFPSNHQEVILIFDAMSISPSFGPLMIHVKTVARAPTSTRHDQPPSENVPCFSLGIPGGSASSTGKNLFTLDTRDKGLVYISFEKRIKVGTLAFASEYLSIIDILGVKPFALDLFLHILFDSITSFGILTFCASSRVPLRYPAP
jgi:hypothetical protein